MMENKATNPSNNIFTIQLGENLILTEEELKSQAGPSVVKHHKWASPILQFVSFKTSVLALRNSCETLSYQLRLQVIDNNLLVGCECGQINADNLCGHAYKALDMLIWRLGKAYFQKLQPGGLMDMAFAYKKYFDKKENLCGLDVEPRPELQFIFRLQQSLHFPSSDVLALPGVQSRESTPTPDEGMAYLVVISVKNRLLPALLPCAGKLNKARTAIKSFYPFVSGIQTQYNHLRTAAQKEINTACHSLWNLVEKNPGQIVSTADTKLDVEVVSKILSAWKQLLPILQQQTFLYTYHLYGVQELKRRPDKSRLLPVRISSQTPELRFILIEKKVFYRLELQVWLNNALLQDCDIETPLFVFHQQTLYLLSCIRDAAIAQWMQQSGGWTIFKVHFAEFDREVLKPLQQYFPVTLKRPRQSKQ